MGFSDMQVIERRFEKLISTILDEGFHGLSKGTYAYRKYVLEKESGGGVIQETWGIHLGLGLDYILFKKNIEGFLKNRTGDVFENLLGTSNIIVTTTKKTCINSEDYADLEFTYTWDADYARSVLLDEVEALLQVSMNTGISVLGSLTEDIPIVKNAQGIFYKNQIIKQHF